MNDPLQTQLVWDAENTHPELAKSLKEALRTVMDPEIGLSVIELGLVRDVTIQDDTVNLYMIMTTPFCPYAPMLLEMTRRKTEEILNMHTTMSLGMDPWEPSMMEEGAGAAWGFF